MQKELSFNGVYVQLHIHLLIVLLPINVEFDPQCLKANQPLCDNMQKELSFNDVYDQLYIHLLIVFVPFNEENVSKCLKAISRSNNILINATGINNAKRIIFLIVYMSYFVIYRLQLYI